VTLLRKKAADIKDIPVFFCLAQAINEEIPEEKRSHTYQAVGLFNRAVRKASQMQRLTKESMGK